MNITVYAGPNCGRCTVMKRALEARGITYTTVDIATDQDAAERLRLAGHRELPVIEMEGEVIGTGYSPTLIDQIAAKVAA